MWFKSFCVVSLSVSVCLLGLLNVQIILCSLQTMQNVLPNGWLTLRKMTLTSCKVSFPLVIVFLPPALSLTLQPANGLMMLNCYKAAVWGCGGDFPPLNVGVWVEGFSTPEHPFSSLHLSGIHCLPAFTLSGFKSRLKTHF